MEGGSLWGVGGGRGLGAWMVMVGVIMPHRPLSLLPSPSPPAPPPGPPRDPQISLQVSAWLEQGRGLGFRPSGRAQLPRHLLQPRCPLTGLSVAGQAWGLFPQTLPAGPARR